MFVRVKKVIGIVLLVANCFVATLVYAQTKTLIHLSPPVKSTQANLFFITNRSSSPIIVDIPPDQHRGASAGWASLLQPQHWSAIVISGKGLTLACFKPKTYRQISCQQRIYIYKAKLSTQGNYWLVENKAF